MNADPASKKQKSEQDEEKFEILVNACFGGFGLSELAMDEIEKAAGGEYRPELTFFARESNLRVDPLVIQIVKDLGEKANTPMSKIEIVKIPVKYKNYYKVTDYDGMESITFFEEEYKLNQIKLIVGGSVSSDEKIQEISKLIF